MKRSPGLAGRIAGAFIDSRLTPLIVIASLALGIGAVLLIPREEEPQIVVPMLDVTTAMPGASPELMSGYGKMDILWLDGGWVRKRPREEMEADYRNALARSKTGFLKARRSPW